MIKPEPNFLDRAIGFVSPRQGAKRLVARMGMQMAMAYKGAESGRFRNNWVTGDDSATPDGWELETLRNRTRDLNRNDAVSSGATDTMGINIIGRGLRPQARIRHEFVGISEEKAKELSRQAEMIWNGWTPRADSGNRLTFDEIQFVAMRKIIEDGEIVALPVMLPEEWREIKRGIELIEADRLQGEDGEAIITGSRGQPKTYNIRSRDDADKPNSFKYSKIPALDSVGRPKILHIFPTKRPGQKRGVPYFAPVIDLFKDLQDYLEAEVVAARVAACLAVFITKTDAYSTAYNAASSTDSKGNRVQQLEPGLVGYLEPGESINVVAPNRPGDSFAPFVEGILRLIGMSLNLPYELLVKDFSKTNYSSARAALLEGRRMFTSWRTWFAAKFCQPVWDLVLEEAFLRGMFDAPKFYEHRAEYCRAIWIGGGWGWVDPVKEVEASRKAIDYGLSNLAEENAAQGRDWEENLEQLDREGEKIAQSENVKILTSAKGNEPKPEDDDDANTKKE